MSHEIHGKLLLPFRNSEDQVVYFIKDGKFACDVDDIAVHQYTLEKIIIRALGIPK